MSLQDGKKNFTDKQQLATGFACSSRTVSPDEQCYRLICASCTQCHSVRKPSSSHKLLPSKGRYHDAADVASGPCVYIWGKKMYNTQSNAKHLLFQFETDNTTPEFDIANKPGTMMPCMTSLPNKGAQTQLWIGNVKKLVSKKQEVNAVNDSGPKTSSISWWPGRHPVSLHFSDFPTGSNNIYREATLGYI